ncbi:MAG: dehydrogenase [Novosphingobium sp. 17-62-19]|uniref:PQQ-dependent sugar dehydrogenase n=1 Tax=Novosphingobium sp. 17-62-19 TaxID=1970406 RepID=UPI000BD2E319|nr:PQQ-dependent sugar dehydrogenase [Novosphingobium sp. 17-62-19]OYX93322.1 MAG: dehydrogenase [Novosphingobium sp. 35-62-5]OZA19686.1 MAG: dehydrogenase [Novosphingobium sp. 17-62-19]HQS97937.1 PQQ-dependent sugar dehydrogenase [Novosphingobium sp.]
MTNPILRSLSPLTLLLASCGSSISAQDTAQGNAPEAAGIAVTDVASFDEPWAMTFLPGTDMALITEKKGTLKLWREGSDSSVNVSGTPKVAYGGQGGFGDVIVAPDFATSGMVYLSWAEQGSGDTRGAVVGRAKLVMGDAPKLEGLSVIWRQFPNVSGKGHYSHRMAFSPDGKYLYVTSGDRQKFTPAQDLTGNLGKVLRLLPDGTPAPGNPMAEKGGVTAQIWSFGHRNLLGIAFSPDGRLWDIEHGPAGGDEINLVEPGKNYGWPLVSGGDHYDGKPIPRNNTRPDLAQPAINWTPVIAPGNMIFYTGTAFPQWQGQAIIAGLGSGGLVRVKIDGAKATELERIDLGNRIREIEQAPDGSIYVLEDGDGAKLRHITPNG